MPGPKKNKWLNNPKQFYKKGALKRAPYLILKIKDGILLKQSSPFGHCIPAQSETFSYLKVIHVMIFLVLKNPENIFLIVRAEFLIHFFKVLVLCAKYSVIKFQDV